MDAERRQWPRPGRARTRLAVWVLALTAGPGVPAIGTDDPTPEQAPTPAIGGTATDSRPSGFFRVAYASIFGPSDYAPWRPLSLRTLFSEGWDEPWIAEPNDSGDAQQGWINSADGNFYRLSFFSYTYTNRLARAATATPGRTPCTRR